MNTLIFDTKAFHQKEFTTGWSYVTDALGQPCQGAIELGTNKVVCRSNEQKFSLNLLIEIPGFGKIVLRTILLKQRKKSYDLLENLIDEKISELQKDFKKNNLSITKKLLSRFRKIAKQKKSLNKLSQLLHLHEQLVLDIANFHFEQRIKQNDTQNFLLGCQAFGIQRGNKYKNLHEETFNLGIAPFYFFLLKDASKEKTDWRLTDEVVEWLKKSNRKIKGHPLLWLHPYPLPDWMKELSFPQLLKFVEKHVTQIVTRYKDSVHVWDIVNEIPSSDANGFDLTMDQLLILTKLVSTTVKKIQPDAERIVNLSDIFGAGSYIHDKPSIPPQYFVKLLEKHNVEYESIGLQFYTGMKKEFACRDIATIDSIIDEFGKLEKPIHISELGWPSQHDVDPTCFFSADHPEAGGWWHRRWDEELQAEYLEKLYIIFASKPFIKSITWWDFTDNGVNTDIGSRFMPFSGLTRRDFSKKPALLAIEKFKRRLKIT